MKFENLLIKTENNITTISINRPKKLNALNIKTFEEIANAVKLNVLNENGIIVLDDYNLTGWWSDGVTKAVKFYEEKKIN